MSLNVRSCVGRIDAAEVATAMQHNGKLQTACLRWISNGLGKATLNTGLENGGRSFQNFADSPIGKFSRSSSCHVVIGESIVRVSAVFLCASVRRRTQPVFHYCL